MNGYAACSFEKGTAEEQFNMFGPMFGFANMGDMIKSWGIPRSEKASVEWTKMTPGTEYEIYVQAWDVNGTYADMIIVPVTTKKYGGEGLAEMTITIGEFGGDKQQGYYQVVTYTPNDQVAMHRDIIMDKDSFDINYGEDKVIEILKTDNPYDPYWNQYGTDVAQWEASPDHEYIAFSIAQNINGEWGPLAQVPFKTPAAPAAQKKAVKTGRITKETVQGTTTIPAAMLKAASKAATGKVTLKEK